MHPLNIPELREFMMSLKNHEGDYYCVDPETGEFVKLEGEEKERMENVLFELLMNDSIQRQLKIYNLERYRKRKQAQNQG